MDASLNPKSINIKVYFKIYGILENYFPILFLRATLPVLLRLTIKYQLR